MKIKYNANDQVIKFGPKGKYGSIKLQKGSLSDHKENGVLDTDVIMGLLTYLQKMNKQKKSNYNVLAIGNLQSAYTFLRYRRINQHLKNEVATQQRAVKNARRKSRKQ